MDDAKDSSKLGSCGSLQFRLYWVESCLQGGTQPYGGLQEHEGQHRLQELVGGGLLSMG